MEPRWAVFCCVGRLITLSCPPVRPSLSIPSPEDVVVVSAVFKADDRRERGPADVPTVINEEPENVAHDIGSEECLFHTYTRLG